MRGAGAERRSGLRLTRAGRVGALLAFGLLLCALNTGANLVFFLTGGLLSALAVNLLSARATLRAAHAERRAPLEVTQGEATPVRVALACAGGTSLSLRVDELAPPDLYRGEPARVAALGVPAEGLEVELSVRFARIGRTPLPPLRLASAAPLGLVEAWRELPAQESLLVLPPLRPLRPIAGLMRAQTHSDGLRWAPTAPERRDAVRLLRDHRPGDDPRQVHWRSTARRGALVVREYERAEPRHTLVALDLALAPRVEAPDLAERRRLEAAQLLAASLVAAEVREGRAVALALAGDEAHLLPPGHGPGRTAAARRAIAQLAPAADPDLAALARLARDSALGAARVLLVSTRLGEAPPAPGALAGARRFVIRAPDDVWTWLRSPEPFARSGADALAPGVNGRLPPRRAEADA